MINKLKEDMHKENVNKQLSEIRKTMQDMKEEFNKNTEILNKNQTKILGMKTSISQVKN
jgi:predicted  nucleic acid-binding Zn-ribbon protein